MSLARIQDAFQSALLDGGDGIMKSIPDGPRESKDVLFGVYRYAYKARLIGILQEDFERLHTFIGDELFEALARDYVAANPSHTPNARYYSQVFPDFVTAYKALSDAPVAAAIARLEGALNDVFDCPDSPALSLDELATFAPEEFEHLTFAPHASARRFDTHINLDEIWSALNEDRTPPPVLTLDEPQRFVVWRKDTTPHYRVLTCEAAMLWDEAAKGMRFGALCEMLAFQADADTAPARAAGYLHMLIADGLLASACK